MLGPAIYPIPTVYGSVPLCYFVLHFYLLRFLNVILFYAQGYSTKDIITPKSTMLFRPLVYGLNLWVCTWFGCWLLLLCICLAAGSVITKRHIINGG